MGLTLRAGQVEGEILAWSLRESAAAYDKADEAQKATLDTQMNGGAAPANEGAAPVASSQRPTPFTIPHTDYPLDSATAAYPEEADADIGNGWMAAAATIHDGDTQALSVKYMRDQWKAHKGTVQAHSEKFATPPAGWEGSAADACTGSMTSLQRWWFYMGDECFRLGEQVEKLADAHDTLVAAHPTMEDVEYYKTFPWSTLPAPARALWYSIKQQDSEAALLEYANAIKLLEIQPKGPPAVDPQPVDRIEIEKMVGSPLQEKRGPGGAKSEDQDEPTAGPQVSPVSTQSPNSGGQEQGPAQSGSAPSGGQGGSQGGGSPGGGSPTGMSGMPMSTPAGDLPELGEPNLKPASAGGAGGGMGRRWRRDAVDAAESCRRCRFGGGVAVRCARWCSGTAPAAGGGMGGMGGGMGGMGGGHGQGQGKEKRRDPKLAEDEDLYIEDRAYTEGIIGRRARKDTKG
ncbi:hypothetical protein ATO49_00290 [Mycolicibacterium fortuitum subsp. fortuitum DSM 46621 = ATCC 6841 = JCM 6387]|nr:hypothetical protein ATO49_00290 [Mycolicibacterium fortuitum subsp. fortuitum DSM 46621 = ATCC 6841 = JCM 6387]